MEEKEIRQEKQIESELRELTDDVQVPASLEPEAIEKLLCGKVKEKRRVYRWKYAGIAAAACLCLAVGIAAAVNHKNSPGTAGSRTDADSGAGSADGSGKNDAAASEKSSGAETQLVLAEDYDEIYEYIQAEQEQAQKQARGTGGAILESSMDENGNGTADTASAYGLSASDGTYADGGYSDTNVREEGVGEADTVKTDGKNLYILSGQTVSVVGITSEEMESLAQISVDDECYVREIYAGDNRLVILYTRTEFNDGETGYDASYQDYTCADVYDVSRPASPKKLGTISQSGYYNTMRVRDGYVYLLSNFYAGAAAARTDTGAYIPRVQGKLLEASSIYMPQGKMGNQYTVISSFPLEDPSEKTDSKAVFGVGGLCYVSTENIYITESYYGMADVTQTSVRKVSYSDGKLTGAAQTKVDGTLDDSFSIDEYDGYLRMVVTVEPCRTDDGIMPLESALLPTEEKADVSNSLYVLDKDLEIVGKIRDLAKDEYVYSARFMGDTGYFVTFRQMDPLFSVDLSDPENPEVIGELKIPGFSDYLHPYGEGRLLGIGMEVDEEGVTTEGVKLSMFDISDPSDVEETAKFVLEGTYGTEASYNYKAVFVDTGKNLFGFSAYGDVTEYSVFSYDETDGFTRVFTRRLNGYGDARGLYAGDKFYLIVGNTVESYTLSGFAKVDDIVL